MYHLLARIRPYGVLLLYNDACKGRHRIPRYRALPLETHDLVYIVAIQSKPTHELIHIATDCVMPHADTGLSG